MSTMQLPPISDEQNAIINQLISNNNVEIETKKEYSIESMSTKISALLITYNEEKNLLHLINNCSFTSFPPPIEDRQIDCCC